MTIQAATRTATFAGNGSTTVFPLPSTLKFFADIDLQVYTYTIATGLLEQALTLGTHYEVSGAGTDSASVTVYTAPASGKGLLVRRVLAITQNANITNLGAFYPEIHEQAFDYLTLLAADNADDAARSMRIAPQFVGFNTEVQPVAGGILGFNGDGTGFVALSLNDLATVAVYQGHAYDKFTATASQTTRTLASAPGSLANLFVSIDGVVQVPTDDYTLSGSVVTFTTPLTAGEKVYIRWGVAVAA